MFLEKVAKIIYEDNTASENNKITIKTHEDGRILWNGNAKELEAWTSMNKGWIVVEVLVDISDVRNIPDYNKAKIITVI